MFYKRKKEDIDQVRCQSREVDPQESSGEILRERIDDMVSKKGLLLYRWL